MSILERQKKTLYMIREEIDSELAVCDTDLQYLLTALDKTDRLLRNVEKKYLMLEDLVSELKYRKQKSEQDLSDYDAMLKNQLLIENCE